MRFYSGVVEDSGLRHCVTVSLGSDELFGVSHCFHRLGSNSSSSQSIMIDALSKAGKCFGARAEKSQRSPRIEITNFKKLQLFTEFPFVSII